MAQVHEHCRCGEGFDFAQPDEPAAAACLVSRNETLEQVHAALRQANATVSVAESLTGGLLGSWLSAVPGASATFHGGVIAYTHAVKHQVLGVDEQVLRTHGAVNAQVAAQMACGVRRLLGTTYGVALTGVAGPHPSDGQAAGTVFLAVVGPEPGTVNGLRLALEGTRNQVRFQAAAHAAQLLRRCLTEVPPPPRR